MSLEKTIQEILVPDIHNNWHFYNRLARIIDSKTKRVFLIGDLRNQIDYDALKKFIPRDASSAYVKFQQIQKQLSGLIGKKYGGSTDDFFEALQSGQVPQELALFDTYKKTAKLLETIDEDAFAKESAVDYDVHEKHVKNIQKSNPSVKFFGVPGNHDTVFMKGQVKSVDWLTYSQSLEAEGIVGALACRENYNEMNPQFNGPNLKYAPMGPEGDDDYDDLQNSKVYQDWTGIPLDLMVTHNEGDWGKCKEGIPREWTGKGVTKLGEENGFVCYSGHNHKGMIYRDPKSKVLVIRPGIHYIAKIERAGKKVHKIQLYRVPQAA